MAEEGEDATNPVQRGKYLNRLDINVRLVIFDREAIIYIIRRHVGR